jgi:tetratricopeptide (TPR) repeat protein
MPENLKFMEQRFTAKRAMEKIHAFQNEKKFLEADATAEKAMHLFPSNLELLCEYAQNAVRRSAWQEAIKRLNKLLVLQGNDSKRDDTVLKLSEIFVRLGQPGEGMRYLSEALEIRPASLMLRRAMAELHLLAPGGLNDPGRWRELAAAPDLAQADDAIRVKVVASCVAGLRLAGYPEEARTLLASHYDPKNPLWPELVKDGYSRLFVLHNGPSRLEFYTKLFDAVSLESVEGERLTITFDTMEQPWDKEPFAFRPLVGKATDFLCLRKRARDDFHQDLSQQDFLRVAIPIAARYRDPVAFGQSLGGYSALYYASWLPACRVLATAPRNPQNPKYSGKKYARPLLFRHEYDMPVNSLATPTIVFDCRNSEDGPYIDRSLRKSFPRARFVSYPYCGHSISRYLLDVGLLKTSTLGFFDGVPFPEFEKSQRGKSSEYLRNLAKLMHAAGHRSWARAMLERATVLGQHPERTVVLMQKFGFTPKIKTEPASPLSPASPPSPGIRKWLASRISRTTDKLLALLNKQS